MTQIPPKPETRYYHIFMDEKVNFSVYIFKKYIKNRCIDVLIVREIKNKQTSFLKYRLFVYLFLCLKIVQR